MIQIKKNGEIIKMGEMTNVKVEIIEKVTEYNGKKTKSEKILRVLNENNEIQSQKVLDEAVSEDLMADEEEKYKTSGTESITRCFYHKYDDEKDENSLYPYKVEIEDITKTYNKKGEKSILKHTREEVQDRTMG